MLGDHEAIAWAKHELGTLRLAAGDVKGADRDLRQAREIRERIGDRRGLAATERTMRVLCDRLREMLREEELVRPSARSGWTTPARLLALAGVFAVLFGGGVAAGMILDNGSGTEDVAKGVDNPDGTGNPGGIDTADGTKTGTDQKPGSDSYPLDLGVAGEGQGTIEAAGYECGEGPCEVAAGETLTIVAVAGRGSTFNGFSGSCSGTESPCTVTATGPISVTASFGPYEGGGIYYSKDGTTDEGESHTGTTEEPPTEETPPPSEEGE